MGCRASLGKREFVLVWRRRALLGALLALGCGGGGGDEKATRLNPQPEFPVIPRSAGTAQEIAKSQGGATSSGKALQGAPPSNAVQPRDARAALPSEFGAGGDDQGSAEPAPN
jgi:hypothetical protein